MEKIREESGVLIVEAAYVFPIVFFVIFFLIYMGNAFYVRSMVDRIVCEETLAGVAYAEDPMLEDIEENGVPTSAKNMDIQPYASIFGHGKIEDSVKSKIKKQIKSAGSGFFVGMQPELTDSDISVKVKSYVVFSQIETSVQYKVNFPIKFIWTGETTVLTISSSYVAPIEDTSSFIRNVDMVKDYSDALGITDKIKNQFSKVQEILDKFKN